MFKGKEKPLSRDDAKQLYSDLQKSVEILKNRKGSKPQPSNGISDAAAREIAMEIKAALKKDNPDERALPRQTLTNRSIETIDRPAERTRVSRIESEGFPSPAFGEARRNRGPVVAISFVAAFAALKLTFGILEFTGVFRVQEAQATYQAQTAMRPSPGGQPYSAQELQILTSLDGRRAELEARRQQLDDRERELEKRDQEFTTRVTELRELSSKLKVDREKTEKKQTTQLTQLANVYNAMNPNEAAQLLDQLDEVTALSLLEHMPEKRIGQILPLMTPERALSMTKMLSGRR